MLAYSGTRWPNWLPLSVALIVKAPHYHRKCYNSHDVLWKLVVWKKCVSASFVLTRHQVCIRLVSPCPQIALIYQWRSFVCITHSAVAYVDILSLLLRLRPAPHVAVPCRHWLLQELLSKKGRPSRMEMTGWCFTVVRGERAVNLAVNESLFTLSRYILSLSPLRFSFTYFCDLCCAHISRSWNCPCESTSAVSDYSSYDLTNMKYSKNECLKCDANFWNHIAPKSHITPLTPVQTGAIALGVSAARLHPSACTLPNKLHVVSTCVESAISKTGSVLNTRDRRVQRECTAHFEFKIQVAGPARLRLEYKEYGRR